MRPPSYSNNVNAIINDIVNWNTYIFSMKLSTTEIKHSRKIKLVMLS